MKQPLCKNTNGTESHRFNYCGTCKSIGSQYGNDSRMFLNYDIVFLSTVLNNLSRFDNYHQSYYNTSCFVLPKKESISTVFKYSSALNLYLAGVKIGDNISDLKLLERIPWLSLQKLFSDRITKAKEDLNKLAFPIKEVDRLLNESHRLEAQRDLPLHAYLKPTSKITGISFSHGAKLIGLEGGTFDLMKRIGELFGEIVYLKDARDDYGKDTLEHNFNPIISSDSIIFQQVNERLENAKEKLINRIDDLDMPLSVRERFKLNLQTLNISSKKESGFVRNCLACCDCADCCCCGVELCSCCECGACGCA